MDTKSFHVGDILSVTTGRLVGPGHIGGVYEVLDFLLGRPHMTHELPHASDLAHDGLMRQVPELAEAMPPDTINSEKTAAAYVKTVTDYIGRTHLDLRPLAGIDDPFTLPDKPSMVILTD